MIFTGELSSSGGLIDPFQNFRSLALRPLKGAHLNLTVPELFVKTPSENPIDGQLGRLPTRSQRICRMDRDYVNQ